MLAHSGLIVIGCVAACILSVIWVPVAVMAQQNVALAEIPAELLTCESRNLDPALLIPFNSLASKLEQKDLVLIDVRGRSDFERLRIPRSINIPLYAIKTKPFLKSKSLILIHKGFCYSPLEPEIRRLENSGFSRVHALKGGLSVWRQRKAPLQGDAFARTELNQVSPHELFSERYYTDVIGVDISENAHAKQNPWIPRMVSLPYGQDEERFMAQLAEVVAPRKNDTFRRIVICNTTGAYPRKFQRLIEKRGMENVFYLTGGLEGYRTFLWQQGRMQLTKRAKGTIPPCNTCP